MSIINEALKKAAEENKKRKDTPYQESRSKDQIKVDGQQKVILKEPVKNNKRAFLIILLILSLGIFFVVNRFFLISQNKEIPRTSSQNISSPPSTSTNFPQLTLNGIVYDEERPYAIVNNKVLLKGEMIEGATLVEIKRDSVKFLFNDKELIIKAK